MAPAPGRSSRPHRTVLLPADRELALPSAPRRSARGRRPLPRLADIAAASTSPGRRTAGARRPLPQPADRAAARRRSARGPAAQTVLPDEIWEDILLRLDAAADLARASAACSSFRGIISERRFLRRFRSLRSPAVLGLIGFSGELRSPAPPHRSAPEARALERAADFTFSFLPGPYWWRFRHARDGRVLLSQLMSVKIRVEDFAVCDPLHRRYVKIPRIPDELMASAADNGTARHLLPVLAPAGENDEEESFRVVCTVLFDDKVMAFVFSSCNQTWQGVISTICLPDRDGSIEYVTYYAHGCLYWMVGLVDYSLMLDTSEMKFSTIDLPPQNFDIDLPPRSFVSMRAIVVAADGRLGFLTIRDGTIDLYCKNWRSNCVGAQEWQHEKLIPLPKDSGVTYHWNIKGTTVRYLALVANHGPNSVSERFVLDIKTLLVENLCTSQNGAFFGFPYARFPPPLALPSI